MVGNLPNYNEHDVLRAFLLIENKPIARSDLVKKLELGEGTIKTILDILKYQKLIVSTNKGHKLIDEGIKKKEKILSNIKGPIKLSLKEYSGLKSCGLLIKNPSNTKINIDLRDEAIRAGAYSSILFRYENELKIPMIDWDYKKENPEDYKKIVNSFTFKKGNLLIVSFAKDYRTCENSALAVMNKIKKIKI
jgi:predicted transcriptional regulator